MSTEGPFGNETQDPFEEEFQTDPFVEDHFGNRGHSYSNTNFQGQKNISEGTTVLVLGIMSIVGSFCYGIFGLILGIIGLAVAAKPMREFRADPSAYTNTSVSNLKAGRVCSIIGIVISSIYIVVAGLIILIAIGGGF